MKKAYTIDYGFEQEKMTGTLEQAKETADDGASYTGMNIMILDEAGSVISRRVWYGVPYDRDATESLPGEIISFGSLGHYEAWN